MYTFKYYLKLNTHTPTDIDIDIDIDVFSNVFIDKKTFKNTYLCLDE